MLLQALLALVPFVLAVPHSQSPFALSSSLLPAQDSVAFINHTLIPLQDGTFVPSPAFGVGSRWYKQDVTKVVLSALRVGYRHLGQAAIYGNEASVGEAIRLSGIPREELYVTSKYDHLEAGKSVEEEFHASLSKLGLSYLDQYLIHFPAFAAHDPEGVWRALESLVDQGLVRTIGVSNYNETDLTSLLAYARVLPSINQIRYHPYNTIAQSASIQKAKKNGIVTAAYSALTPLTKEPGGAVDDVVRKIGHKEDMTDGQVILDWVKEKGILVVTTSGDPGRQAEQLEVFGKAFEDLSRKDMKRLDKAGRKQERKQM